MRRLALLGAACALACAPAAALAQPPAVQFPGGFAPGGAIEGWDTVLLQRCIVGSSPTCTAAPGSGMAGSGFPSDVLTSGSITAATPNAAFTVSLASGEGTTAFRVSGLTGSGAVLTLEGSNDGGANWTAINEVVSSGAYQSTVTADGQFRVNTAGRTKVRLRVSTVGTGTISVAANASSATGSVRLSEPGPVTAAAGALVDGAVTTLGSESDPAWSGAGSASVVSISKKIAALLAATPANAPANFTPSQLTLTATASQIVAARPGRVTLTIYNTSSAIEYVGPAGVSTATGFPIPSGQAVSLSFQGALYGVVSTGSASAAEYETY